MKWNLSLGSMALIWSSGWAQSSRKSLPHHLIMSNICLYCFTVAPLRHACNFYYRFLLHSGRQGMLEPISAEGVAFPRTRRQFIIGRQRQTTIHTLTRTYGQFRVPSWHHVLEGEDGSQSIWERTAKIRKKKLHTGSSQAEESNTQPLLLWGNTTNPELQQILS